MVMSDDSWYVVRNTPGVTGFVGSGSKPIPLTEDEMRTILRQMGVEEPTVKVAFEIGETVRVVSGPFENLDGIVQEVSPERGRLRVQVSMFEREIPVELDFADVEKY
jgi:transcriptional antiterminator NusG